MNNNNLLSGEKSGPIAFMASNGVAANLLMWGIIAAGIVGLSGLEREAWPEIPFYHVEVGMVYPGATPGEIEESIIVKIEDEVEGLDHVVAVKSTAAPGMASVRIEMKSGADMAQAITDVESAVNQIQTFPASAERPWIREMTNRQSLMRLLVHGNVSERTLKELAYQIEEELAALPSVSQVDVTGTRDYEISIEVPQRQLRALGLTLEDISHTIRRSSLDLSAGSMDTRDSQVRIRTIGQNYDQQDFEEIVLLSASDGTVVRLGDVAEVRDGFNDANLIIRHQDNPAVFVEVFRAGGENVSQVAGMVHQYLDEELLPALPDGVGITVWNDESQDYKERADLLAKNGIIGLLLVFIALGLFLQIQLAIWVAVGLVVAGVGALAVMLALDFPINTISLFSFFLAIGIIIDDAIVVSEHIQYERNKGTPALLAAIRGARRIKVPLTFAVLTSVAAFSPLLFIPGGVGDTWKALPIIIISMLLISLVESLFVLPNHLSHLRGPDFVPTKAHDRFLTRVQGGVNRQLNRFVEGPLDRVLRFATEQPAITLALAIGALLISFGLVAAGIVPTTLADEIEGDLVTVTLTLPDGTPLDRTYAMATSVKEAGLRVIADLEAARGEEAGPLLRGTLMTVGQGPRIQGGGLNPEPTLNPPSYLATVEFKLQSAQERTLTTGDVAQAWREEVGTLPEARGLTFSGDLINLGNPIEVGISHPDEDVLINIAESILNQLRGVGGVFDIRSDHAPGVPEIQLELRPEARTLGFTVDELARQTRGAFFGSEAVRVQRGREEIRVYVRLPENERNSITSVEGFRLKTPGGSEVPVVSVASLSSGLAAPIIRRRDSKRVITITGDVDATSITSSEANDILENSILADLQETYPELTYSFGGEAQQQLQSLGALYRGFAIAMLMVFALLAIPLSSYTKPFIIMAVIPFGLVGVILGHFALGIELSAVSFMGVFGLSGVVVNDSLVMIDFIDQKIKEGRPLHKAIVEGAKGRFRPIMLTSVTTFLGFSPLVFERAIQAQFMLPFGASLGFGILATTALLMVVVPALYAIHGQFGRRKAAPAVSD